MFQRMICYFLSVAACLVLLSTHVATAQESKEAPIATAQDDAADVLSKQPITDEEVVFENGTDC